MKFLDYIKGIRKGKDAHDIEYDAMSDPFWAEAIEGFDSVEGNHTHRIAQMQSNITAKTVFKKKRSRLWQIGVAAIAFIAILSGYFSLMNHRSSMAVANCENCFINIYAPEDYIERKRLELAMLQEQDPTATTKAIVNIENLKEIISPIEPISLYIPGDYAYNKNVDEEKEIAYYERNKFSKEDRKETNFNVELLSEVKTVTISDVQSLSKDISIQNSFRNSEQVQTSPILRDEQLSSSSKISTKTNKKTISGKIVDEMNEPLIGATVIVKGTNHGVVTNIDGNYNIQTDSESTPLIASYLGYETIEIPDTAKNQIVALKPDKKSLDEVVVVGYGSQKKRSLIGSVSSISSKSDFTKKQQSKPIIGMTAYKKYLNENRLRLENGICSDEKGKVVLEFSVGIGGRPQNIIVVKSLCDVLDNDAILLIESGSDWTHSTEKVQIDIYYK